MGGRHKLLVDLGGEALVCRAVRAAMESTCRRTLVVTGFESSLVEAAVTPLGAVAVRNEEWREGLSASLRCGLRALDPQDDAALVLLADMPGIRGCDIDRILAAFDRDRPRIVVPVRSGRRGNPVLWPRQRFDDLMQLRGDAGARALLDLGDPGVRAVEFDHDGIFEDIDTPDALQRLSRRHAPAGRA